MRDMAQGLLDRLVGFTRGHSSSDRAHPGVGIAFIIAALVVLFFGLRWFNSEGASGTTSDQSWALEPEAGSSGSATTIGASPEAEAVRVGTALPHGAAGGPDEPEQKKTVKIGIPGTSIEIEIPLSPTTTGPGPGGSTRPPTTRPGSPSTNPPPTDPPPTDPPPTDPPPTDPTTTEDTTTTTEDTTTTGDTTTVPGALGLNVSLGVGTSENGGLVGTVLGAVASLLG